MRNRAIAVLAALMLAGCSCEASAYFDTGNALFAVCEGRSAFEIGDCMGTIVGHYDMMMALGYRCGNDSTKSKQQMRDIVVKYLRDNPADRSEQAATLSFVAFFAAFSCTVPISEPAKK